jgi:hypothetical protein
MRAKLGALDLLKQLLNAPGDLSPAGEKICDILQPDNYGCNCAGNQNHQEQGLADLFDWNR